MLLNKQVRAAKAAVATKVDRLIRTLKLGAQKSDKYQKTFSVNLKEI
jgi:hypothetical protein